MIPWRATEAGFRGSSITLMVKSVSPLDQKQALLNRIEDLWLEAAAIMPENALDTPRQPPRLDDTPPPLTPEPDDGAVLDRINQLMQEAESVEAGHDTGHDTGASIDDLAEAVAGNIDTANFDVAFGSPASHGDPADRENTANALANQLAAMMEQDPARPEDSPKPDGKQDFDGIKSGFETVAQLQPPHPDNGQKQNPEYAFGEAFSNLVRSVVRQYIDNEFEATIRHAISDELRSHFDQQADNPDNDRR